MHELDDSELVGTQELRGSQWARKCDKTQDYVHNLPLMIYHVKIHLVFRTTNK